MQTAKSTVSERYARKNVLESIDWTTSGIAASASLSPRARRLLQLYVSIAKLSYCGLIVPIGALSDTFRRVLDGGGCSVRTIQRANRELADKNFIFIYQKRDNFSRIKFNPEAFSFWTGIKTKSVLPIPTKCDTVPHATNCHPEDRRNINSRVNLRNSSDIIQKQRAGARAVNIRSKTRKNPIVFSLLCVLRKADNLHVSDRRLARLRAQCEVDALAAGIALVNPSGVDWDYWRQSWEQMTIAVRETTIRREILPFLLGRPPMQEIGAAPPPPAIEPPVECPIAPSAAELSALIQSLKIPCDIITESAPKSAPRNLPEITLPAGELAILEAARRRVKGL